MLDAGCRVSSNSSRVCGAKAADWARHGLRGGEKRRDKDPGAEAENGSQGTPGNAKTSGTLS